MVSSLIFEGSLATILQPKAILHDKTRGQDNIVVNTDNVTVDDDNNISALDALREKD